MPLLHIDTLNLMTRCGRHVVRDLSLTLEAGECLALVGESGAGKSLTSLAVMQLLPPSVHHVSGSITLDGHRLDRISPQAMRHLRCGTVGMILQNPMSAFDPLYTIRQHFAESLRARPESANREPVSPDSIHLIALQSLAESGFEQPESVLDIYPFQMSGGMLQRVMIALALLHQPKLLIADEATTDLDAALQRQIVELLARRRAERRLAMLLITHDLSVAAALAGTIAVIREGSIVDSGPTDRLLRQPRSPYSQALVEAARKLYGGSLLQPSTQGDGHAAV